ncbi:MAG: DUF4469 domain-containing protein [Marinilabiliaceae bacterium]|nr:DUF4469 domain-containing protein [Marinilabiliaceae bacterium]
MSLKYSTRNNPLTTVEDDCIAQTHDVETLTEKDLLNEIVVPGGVTNTQLQAVVTSMKEVILKKLRQGYGIRTALVHYYPTISGVFTDDEDSFDPNRHSVNIKTTPNKEVKEAAASIRTQKVTAPKRIPFIQKFIDTASNTRDNLITPGLVAEIKGELLKLDPTDLSQGVFLIDSNKTLHRCEKYIRNTPTNLIFYIPGDIPTGQVELRVRMKIENDSKLREGIHSVLLTVAQQQQ